MMNLPAVGETFAGKYTIRELLGRGGNAAVFRARDDAMSRDVAVKIILPDAGGYPPQVVGRFMREGRVVAGLVDPHNITMFDFGKTDDGVLYMVFEYVDGQELGVFLKEQGPLKPRVVAHILDQLLQGLEEAHQAGILHRDVKPANILVFEYAGDPYRVKLLDFGIARPASAEGPASVTTDGVVVGTPRYMAPEQMLGTELTASSDLFSLGLVAYEMLVGRPAFDGTNARELAKQQFAQEPLELPRGCAPPDFIRLIERMISRHIEDRPRSARAVRQEMLQMKKALGRWVGIEHATTAPHRPVARPARAPRRRRSGYARRFLLLAAIALVIGAGLAVIILHQLKRRAPPRPIVTRSMTLPTTPSAKPAPDSPTPGTPPDAPDVGRVDLAPSRPGCGSAEEPGTRFLETDTATGRRSWAVHVPKGYDGETALPVMLIFHRSLADGQQMLQDTGMDDVADERGFFVLAPTSPDQLPWREKFREEEFVRLLVARTAERFCLDLRHVYFVGEGRGGEFVEDFACDVPVSGIALTLSGQSAGGGMCTLQERRAPRIRIYGKLDRYVPAAGGKGCLPFSADFLSAAEIQSKWKKQMRCRGKAKTWLDEPGGRCRTWKCEVPFVHCATTGGHDWPGSSPKSIDFPGCEEDAPKVPPIEYGPAIWNFFEQNGTTLSDHAAKIWREGT